jgi:hypothetical protein
MPEGLVPVLLFVLAVIVYVIVRVYQYSRKSEEEWNRVDKSKLRAWDDEDED